MIVNVQQITFHILLYLCPTIIFHVDELVCTLYTRPVEDMPYSQMESTS